MLIFDGDCGFCTTSARWIEARLPSDVPVVAWQSIDVAAFGLTEEELATAAYFVDDEGVNHRGHAAIEQALRRSGMPWKAAGIAIGLPPFSWIAPTVYKLVAKYRYKLPGATDACKLPQP